MSNTYKIPVSINNEIFQLEISLVDIQELYPHEKIFEPKVNELITKINRNPIQKHPIIVDKNSNVILDGMHRLEAFRRINSVSITVCYVDYSNELIKLGKWLRVFKNTKYLADSLNSIDKVLNHKIIIKTNANYEHNHEKEIAIIRTGNKKIIILSKEEENIYQRYKMFSKIEYILTKKLCKPEIISEAIAFKNKGLYLIPPDITKREVIYFAHQGKLFPPKTTRHEIPARPLFLNVPLRLLKMKNINDANLQLKSLILSKNLGIIHSGAIFDRDYPEMLIIFWE